MTNKDFHFDAALKELEEITQWFESSEVDLDKGLVKFERGMELATELKSHLETIENRVEKIKAKFSAKASELVNEDAELHTREPESSEPTGLF
jgi:exodeoxyribonuclease VII small subunit